MSGTLCGGSNSVRWMNGGLPLGWETRLSFRHALSLFSFFFLLSLIFLRFGGLRLGCEARAHQVIRPTFRPRRVGCALANCGQEKQKEAPLTRSIPQPHNFVPILSVDFIVFRFERRMGGNARYGGRGWAPQRGKVRLFLLLLGRVAYYRNSTTSQHGTPMVTSCAVSFRGRRSCFLQQWGAHSLGDEVSEGIS